MMNGNFYEYLKKNRRSASVIQNALHMVEEFCQFYLGRKNSSAKHAAPADLDAFIEYIEKGENAKNVKAYLRELLDYFQFVENHELAEYASQLHKERITS